MTLRGLYDIIEAAIVADPLDTFKQVRYWNSQVEKESEDLVNLYPCIFVQFDVTTYSALQDHAGQVDLGIIIHVVHSALDAENAIHLDLIDKAIALLSGLGGNTLGNGLGELICNGIVIDHDHSNLLDHQLSFRCRSYINNVRMYEPLPNTVTASVTQPIDFVTAISI